MNLLVVERVHRDGKQKEEAEASKGGEWHSERAVLCLPESERQQQTADHFGFILFYFVYLCGRAICFSCGRDE